MVFYRTASIFDAHHVLLPASLTLLCPFIFYASVQVFKLSPACSNFRLREAGLKSMSPLSNSENSTLSWCGCRISCSQYLSRAANSPSSFLSQEKKKKTPWNLVSSFPRLILAAHRVLPPFWSTFVPGFIRAWNAAISICGRRLNHRKTNFVRKIFRRRVDEGKDFVHLCVL